MATNTFRNHLAVGYHDGDIKLWSVDSATVQTVFRCV
jgi:hypothetical protein